MRKSPSLAGRVLVALVLAAGFYTLALGISAGLLFAPYGLYSATGRVNAQLTIFCLVSAVLILYSIAPRIDRFIPPGPRMSEAEHPRLFELIRHVSKATGQAMPADVYLVPELNAWVSNRGGVLGIGSRRVMGLGLPTFQALTAPQLAAVIAHEFGHYHQGDVALGPWLYRVRQGIARTLHTLEQRNNILMIPFGWYGNLFVRVTTAVSRRQEYGADALAASVAGRTQLTSGLEAIHAYAPIYDGYWATEVIPVLVTGRRPRITQGFSRFAAAPRVRSAADVVLQGAMEAPEDPYDTHPPLARRLAAVAAMPDTGVLHLPSAENATALLGDIDALEKALLDHLIADETQRPAAVLEWEAAGREVWVPTWQARIAEAGDRLDGIRCGDAAALAADPGYLAVRMRLAARSSVAEDEHRAEAALLFGSALTLVLIAKGGTLRVDVGDDAVVELAGVEVRPFRLCHQLAAGEETAEAWVATCEQLGILDTPLAEARSFALAVAE